MSALIDYKTKSQHRMHNPHQHLLKLISIQVDISNFLCSFSDGGQAKPLRGNLLTRWYWLQRLSNDSKATYWHTRGYFEGFPDQGVHHLELSLRHTSLAFNWGWKKIKYFLCDVVFAIGSSM